MGELDNYVGAGSIVQVVADRPFIPEAPQSSHVLPVAQFENLRVYFRPGDTSDRAVLDGLQVETYDHIIVLSDVHTERPATTEPRLDPQQADARTLITLLHLRDIADRLNQDFSIVSEMLDIRNRELADATRADDFIVSDKLISLLLSQVSENRELAAVFTDLFSPDGLGDLPEAGGGLRGAGAAGGLLHGAGVRAPAGAGGHRLPPVRPGLRSRRGVRREAEPEEVGRGLRSPRRTR